MSWFPHNSHAFSRWTPPTREEAELYRDMMKARGQEAERSNAIMQMLPTMSKNRHRPGWERMPGMFNRLYDTNIFGPDRIDRRSADPENLPIFGGDGDEGDDTEASTRSQGGGGGPRRRRRRKRVSGRTLGEMWRNRTGKRRY